MDHIDTLVNRLRTYSQSLVAYKLDADFADACTEAADALEKLQAKLERVTRELDAAGEDMKCIADNSMCECCVHNNSEDEEQFCDKNTIVYGCNQFEWRGLKEA